MRSNQEKKLKSRRQNRNLWEWMEIFRNLRRVVFTYAKLSIKFVYTFFTRRAVFTRFRVFILIISWLFSGWPQIFNFPPGIQKALAALPGYRSSGTFTAGTGAITPPYPADMAANAVCLLAVSSENQTITLTTANGFVEVPTWSPQGAGTAATDPASMLALYWKRTVGGDSAPVVADSVNNTEGQIHCFTGVITSGDPWDTGAGGNDSAANDTSGTIPGAITSVADALVVLITST
ncbi:MAG: hypothetical protein Q8N43_00325, partial [Candidatus Azambacteria bacterium]|nr:hypothetical protein [Candidatus Azambacteria bacterium]